MSEAFNRPERDQSARGATRLGLLDVLTALALLATLLYASWKQFPAYRNRPGSAPTPTQLAPAPRP